MARQWAANLVGVGDVYPTKRLVPFNARDFYNYSAEASITDDEFEGAPWVVASPYRYYLDERPIRTTLTITLDAVPASLVEDTDPSGTGIVRINWTSGEVKFHSSDAGKTVIATYDSFGSVLDATMFMRMMLHIAALESLAAAVNLPPFRIAQPAARSVLPANDRLSLPQSDTPITVKRIWVHSADPVSGAGSTIFKVTTLTTTAGFVENTNGITTPTLTGAAAHSLDDAKDWEIDLSGGPLWLSCFCTSVGGHQNCSVGMELG